MGVEKLLEEVRAQGVEKALDALGLNYKPKANQYALVCPFHPDRNPSLFIDNEGKWKCFGCDAGGGIIDFVEKYLSVSRVEAIRWLENVYGVENDSNLSPLASGLKKVWEHFRDRLMKSGEARSYLRSRLKRLSDIEKFIGYDDGTLPKLSKEEYDALSRVGVIKNGKSVLRGRIVFPIRYLNGGLAGFNGRTIKGDIQPKYLLTRFKKSKAYFGEIKRDIVYVCEGVFDALSVGGISFLGISLSNEQIDFLKQLYENGKQIVLAYDIDSAGLKARVTNAIKLAQNGIVAYTTVWDRAKGKDLNELLLNDEKAFNKALSSRITVAKYLALGYKNAKTPEKKQFYIRHLKELLSASTAIVRDIYLADIKAFLPEAIFNELQSVKMSKQSIKQVKSDREQAENKQAENDKSEFIAKVTNNEEIKLVLNAILQRFSNFEPSLNTVEQLLLPFQIVLISQKNTLKAVRKELKEPFLGSLWKEAVAKFEMPKIESVEPKALGTLYANFVRQADDKEDALMRLASSCDMILSYLLKRYLDDPLTFALNDREKEILKTEFDITEEDLFIAISNFLVTLAIILYLNDEKLENFLETVCPSANIAKPS